MAPRDEVVRRSHPQTNSICPLANAVDCLVRQAVSQMSSNARAHEMKGTEQYHMRLVHVLVESLKGEISTMTDCLVRAKGSYMYNVGGL